MFQSVNVFFVSRKTIYTLFFTVYLIAGLYTELKFIINNPIPDSLLADFKYYEGALINALEGKSPYLIREIGPGYLYPPPALLIVEIFYNIDSFPLKAALYSGVNICLLILMIYETGKYYGYSTNQIWYWYVICLSFAPFLELLHIGQINIITLFGIFIFFIWAERNYILSAAALALGILTKFSPILFFIYIFSARKREIFWATIGFMIFITFFSALRYGSQPIFEYPSVLIWLTNQFENSGNSQSFVAKLIGFDRLVSAIVSEISPNYQNFKFTFFATQYKSVHTVLTIYILLLIGLSSLLLFLDKKLEKEPSFIIVNLGMVIMPNIIWYHHYVFLLFPILLWMGWSKLNFKVVVWCLAGLFSIQIDRWHWTYGLSAHIFGHISILILVFYQFRHYKIFRLNTKKL